jgi:hypothetical protein
VLPFSASCAVAAIPCLEKCSGSRPILFQFKLNLAELAIGALALNRIGFLPAPHTLLG